ncbi:MAG: lasso RiPP family leader peptide-containing protein [Pyrinomonadaceae bacterium]
MSSEEKETEKKQQEKEPYSTPVLVLYGSVPELTGGGSGAMAENKGNKGITRHP